MPPFKFYSILNSATKNDHASKSWRYLERWNIDEPLD